MAKIQARSKFGKKFNISVEDKHKYINFNTQPIRVNKPDGNKIDDNGFCIGVSNLTLFELTDNITITQGTAEDQRVGNKIFMKFLHWTYNIYFEGNSLITNFPHGTITDFYARFRVMVVKFETAMSEQDIVDWFKATYIYFKTAGNNDNTIIQSVHQTKMRESTVFTGKFKILYDKKFKMGRKKSVKMSNVPIKINQNLNFDSTNHVTDETFKYIYGLIIGPCNNRLDMDAISSDSAARFSSEYKELATVGGVLKYEYYDL